MLAKKKKLGKKNIQEDKLVTFYSNTLKYFDAYKNQVYIGAAAIIILIAAIVYYGNQSKTAEIEASAALAKAEKVYQSGNYQSVIDGSSAGGGLTLAEVADNYSGSEAGEVARVYLANSYFYTGDYENALDNYEDYSGSIPLYKATAAAGIASCYEAMGETEKAAKKYKDAAFTYADNAMNSQYLLNASVNYIKVNENDEAESLLTKLKEEYPTSPEAREADRYLAEIQLHEKS